MGFTSSWGEGRGWKSQRGRHTSEERRPEGCKSDPEECGRGKGKLVCSQDKFRGKVKTKTKTLLKPKLVGEGERMKKSKERKQKEGWRVARGEC